MLLFPLLRPNRLLASLRRSAVTFDEAENIRCGVDSPRTRRVMNSGLALYREAAGHRRGGFTGLHIFVFSARPNE